MKTNTVQQFLVLLLFTSGSFKIQATLTNDQINDKKNQIQANNQINDNQSYPASTISISQFKLKMREIKEHIQEICMSKLDFDVATLHAKLDQVQEDIITLDSLDPSHERHDRNIRHLNNEVMRARIKCSS